MICISIGERTAEGCIYALKGADFAEIRLDMMEPAELSEANVRRIFSNKAKLIATCRPGRLGEGERKRLLGWAIDCGAAFVDIELEAGDDFKKELAAKARGAIGGGGSGPGKGCKVIVSYHDYRRTPPAEELRQITSWCFDSGADIAKIACMVNSERDAARLLGLLDSDEGSRLVVVGMGPKGKITRIVAPLLGSPFTYASSGEGKETAQGQMDLDSLEKAIGGLKRLG